MSEGRILLIDAYDSFSNNITRLLQEELGVSTECIKIDDPRFVLNDGAFIEFTRGFDAIVLGPGPGHPAVSEDVGLFENVWSLPEADVKPVLGICLGFQSLCLAYGARTARLKEPRHGLVTEILHQSTSIFTGSGHVLATQYHSLHMLLDNEVEPRINWGCTPVCRELTPIAWDNSDSRNGPILMAVQHVSKPYTGVQFHPESICTNVEGRRLVRTWWQQASTCNKRSHKVLDILPCCHSIKPLPTQHGVPTQHASKVHYHKMDARPDVLGIAELLKTYNNGRLPIVLQSGCRNSQPLNAETGRFSILGLQGDASTHFRYSVADGLLHTTVDGQTTSTRICSPTEVYSVLHHTIKQRRASDGPAEVPFWGGLVGYISYEAGLASLDVTPSSTSETRPDIWFTFIERSIVIDHVTGSVYIQTLLQEDTRFLDQAGRLIAQASSMTVNGFHHAETTSKVTSEPKQDVYLDKVKLCQEHLRAGQSYELCLTEQTTIHSNEDAWSIYKRLSGLNPAPFGAFLQFNATPQTGITVVGSSPERFLSWSRTGKCQFRPIKGTVSKATGATRADAEAILRTQKEMAENLMIVDLIRHDLASVKGVHNVRVPALMSVEEYETVFQLVSVIEGDLAPSTSGISLLAASLPPGSMTGAPKRRSCELLKALEDDRPRGLYSGVIGYLDIGGGGDFSVVIRTAFKWLDEDVWRIGAGGAVTVLSTPEGEYEEMLVKRERLLDVLLNV